MADNNGLIDFEDEERDDMEPERDSLEAEVEEDDVDLAALLKAEDYEDEEETDSSDEQESSDGDEHQEDEQSDETFKNEENARNAERRRQNEQRLMERLRQQSPEFQLAQQLSAMYGKPVDQLMADLQEAQIQKQAQEQGIPVEVAKQMSQMQVKLQELEQRDQVNEFMQWNTRVDGEMSALKTEYPMLNDDDMLAAKAYLLQTLKNTDIPLKQAVLAVHGEKILQGVQESGRNEALAQAAGRKANSVIPPKGKSSTNTKTLSADEALVAKEIFGMSEEDYLKYK
mgnify:CR=1 FL=1